MVLVLLMKADKTSAAKMSALFVSFFVFFGSAAFAQNTQSAHPGITPDNFLYGLDVFFDNVRLALTLDETAKAKLGLEIAQERLAEIKIMVEAKKFSFAQSAEKEHSNILLTVRFSASAISKANSTQEIEDEIKIEKGIEEHEKNIGEVQQEIEVKTKTKINITTDQETLLGSIFDSLKNVTGKVKLEIKLKQGETKIKIRQETRKNDTEIENEIRIIEKTEGLEKVKLEKASEKITDAKEEISEVQTLFQKINTSEVDVTAALKLFDQSLSHLNQSLSALSESKFGESFGQANSAEQLAKNAKKILERILENDEVGLEEKKNIEVETEEGKTSVKVEIGDAKMKFRIGTAETASIISEISTRTGLTAEEVQKIMKVKVEENKAGCQTDKECAAKTICPQVVGGDTPLCKNNKCVCGPKEKSGKTEEKTETKVPEGTERVSKDASKVLEEATKESEKISKETEKVAGKTNIKEKSSPGSSENKGY